MTIGVGSIGESPIGAAEDGGSANTVALTATISLDTLQRPDLFAPIKVSITDSVDLTAPIDLSTDTISLTAAIDLSTTDTISLTAAISLQTSNQADANASNGFWTLACEIDGVDFSDRLTGDAEIDCAEDESGIATVVIYPPDGAVTLADYVSKPIVITHQTVDAAGALISETDIYRGYISNPLYDPDLGRLTLECTTDLVNALNEKDRTSIEALVGGNWSPVVFEEGAQGYAYATDRLRTRPASMWHSPAGIVITDWAAKTTADIEFTDDEVVDGSISYENATRQDLLNKIQIGFDYRYDRMRQRTINCLFSMTVSFCDFLINSFKLPQRSMIESAAAGGGWVLQGEVQFVDLPPPGYYRCFPSASTSTQKYIGWGKIILGGYLVKSDDVDSLCWGASWKAAKRWSQKITDRYSIIVQAPQSQAGNGDIVSTESYSLQSEQSIDDWLTEESFDSVGNKTGFQAVGDSIDLGTVVLGDTARDATDDVATGRAAADLARQVMIDAAVTDLLQAHRATSVTWTSTFQPLINLTKTARLNTTNVTAKGKVRRYRHLFGIESGQAETEITVAVSRHFGTGLVTTSPTTPESPPDKPVETGIPSRKYLPVHIGGLTTTPALVASWDGYFTNYEYDPTNTQPFAANPTNPQAVIYPEQFVCEYPEISGAALDNVELSDTQTVDVEIPLDELTLTQ